ncbi:hypothetical protein DFH11DRAFT_945974 [Phellopilus nigrolimitatus]|nr:hypothetical protein DFH11DRAFT_945974 [Phellopilus nigrolimitatus]
MRVLALYQNNRRLTACLRALFSLEAAFGLGVMIIDNIREELSVASLAEGITVCVDSGSPPKVWGQVSWAVTLMYAIILMVLALCKAAQHWRESAISNQFNIVKVLVQDQAIYFILVIFCTVVRIVADELIVPNLLLANLLDVVGSPSLLSVIGSHLLIHLKEAGERGVNGGSS